MCFGYRFMYALLLLCTVTCYGMGQRADSLQQVLSQEQNPEHRIGLLRKLGNIRSRQGATDSVSFGYYQELIRLGRTYGDSVSIATGLLYTGFHHYMNRRTILSTQTYQYALNSLKYAGNEWLLKARIYNCMGISYAHIGSYSIALSNYHKALALIKKLQEPQEKADILNNIRSCFEYLSISDSVIYYSELSLDAYRYLLANDSDSTYYTTGIGKALIALEKPIEAINYLNQGLVIAKRKQDIGGIANSHRHLGACYQQLKDYKQAKYHYLMAIRMNDNMRPLIMRKLSEIAVMEKDYTQAYKYLDEYVHAMDTLRSTKVREQMFELQQIYQDMATERQILQVKNEAMRSSSLANLFSGLFAATLIILIFTGILYWQKKQNANKLSLLNQEISYINQHLDELVQQRTAVIAQQKEQIEKFAHMNAHHIRAPVATILGLVNLIEQEDLLHKNREVEEHLKITAQKMDAIIRQVQEALDKEDWEHIEFPPME